MVNVEHPTVCEVKGGRGMEGGGGLEGLCALLQISSSSPVRLWPLGDEVVYLGPAGGQRRRRRVSLF